MGHVNIVQALLNVDGIQVNKARTDDRVTPINMASFEGHTNVVHALLSVPGIDIFATNKGGDTPLESARKQGHSRAVSLLQNAEKAARLRRDYKKALDRKAFAGNKIRNFLKLLKKRKVMFKANKSKENRKEWKLAKERWLAAREEYIEAKKDLPIKEKAYKEFKKRKSYK